MINQGRVRKYFNKWHGLAFGALSGVKRLLHTKNKQKNKIQDAHNGTKIGASNIFGG